MDRKRIVVVTGVTRGIGHALAESLIGLGHIVCGCGRSQDVISNLKNQYEPSHHFHVVDVADGKQAEKWASEVIDAVGPPDLLVNNAGIMNAPNPLWEVPEAEFASIMRVNVCGSANVIRAFAPAMIRNGTGVIANISSAWGRSTSPEVGPYCASKWAVEGMTRSLSQELPRGIAAVAVNPGIIDTEVLRTCWGDGAASYPTPEEWAETAVPFLLSLSPDDNGRSVSII